MNYTDVFGGASIVDDALGLPPGSSALAATAAVTLVSLLFARKACARPGKKSKKAVKSTVLLAGPAGSGKTAMLHNVSTRQHSVFGPPTEPDDQHSISLPLQLAFGSTVDTLTSMKPNTIRKKLAGDEQDPSAPVVTLVDFPGAATLRAPLLRTAADSGAIVVVLDATTPRNHIVDAADLLYDLFTDPVVSAAAPPVLLAVNKWDLSTATSMDHIQQQLEVELDRLKTSRAAVGVIGDDTAPMHLGRPNAAFTFAEDVPCPVTWCTCVSAATPAAASSKGGAAAAGGSDSTQVQLDDVRSFIVECVKG